MTEFNSKIKKNSRILKIFMFWGIPLLRQIRNILNFFMQLLGVTVTMKHCLQLDIWIGRCWGPC